MSTQVETHIDVQLTNRNRQTIFFRWILVAPVVALASAFTQMAHWGFTTTVVVVPVVFTMLFRGIYPSYALTFNHAMMEFSTRIGAYALLLTDDYPSIERNENIAVIFPDIEGGSKLSRGLPLVKWILAIPLYIVGIVYLLLTIVTTILAWAITSVTGNMPEWAAMVALGTIDFWNRVYGYAFALVSDEYPSFGL